MLYLVADETSLTDRWKGVFSTLDPVVLSSLAHPTSPDSVVMASDRAFEGIADVVLQSLFRARTMVLSMVPTFDDAQKFLAMGAMGYGNAMMHPSHLKSAYQAMEEGKVWLHPDFIGMMITQIQEVSRPKTLSVGILETLSKREREVALLIGDGATHQEIADSLDITIRTVKAHATSIYQKLNVKDRLALSLLLHS